MAQQQLEECLSYHRQGGAAFGLTGKTDDVLNIGARENANWLNGQLDECALFLRTVDSTDVNAIFDFGLSGSAAPGARRIFSVT